MLTETGLVIFKTAAIVHSATHPTVVLGAPLGTCSHDRHWFLVHTRVLSPAAVQLAGLGSRLDGMLPSSDSSRYPLRRTNCSAERELILQLDPLVVHAA